MPSAMYTEVKQKVLHPSSQARRYWLGIDLLHLLPIKKQKKTPKHLITESGIGKKRT